MRGDDERQASVWSYIPLEQRVPADHPLRPMRAMVDAVLTELSPQFEQLYARVGAGCRSPRSGSCGPCCCMCSTACAARGC